jgi:hypothetical protein
MECTLRTLRHFCLWSGTNTVYTKRAQCPSAILCTWACTWALHERNYIGAGEGETATATAGNASKCCRMKLALCLPLRRTLIRLGFAGWFLMYLWDRKKEVALSRIWRVLKVLYSTQNDYDSGLCPTSGSLNSVPETGSVSVLRWVGRDTYSVGSLRKS